LPPGWEYTDEDRERRAYSQRGVYPGTYRKGQVPIKSSYYISAFQLPVTDGHPIAVQDYAERLIASIPTEYSASQKREYWEHSLLAAYFHLYGEAWSHWAEIIPWLRQSEIGLRADRYGCEMAWDWSAKNRFLNANGFRWSLQELNRLVDRYPDYQKDNDSQGMYIHGKPFEDIRQVAEALNLPTAKTLMLLSEFARKLQRS